MYSLEGLGVVLVVERGYRMSCCEFPNKVLGRSKGDEHSDAPSV
jgi:hypothetical protein